MLVLVSITIFSFTEKSSFSSSIGYKILEILAVVSIIGAAGSELVMLLTAMCETITSCIVTNKDTVSGLVKAKKAQGTEVYSTASLVGFRRESEKMVENGKKKLNKLEEKRGNEEELPAESFDNNPFQKIQKNRHRGRIGEKIKRKNKKVRLGVIVGDRRGGLEAKQVHSKKEEKGRKSRNQFGTGFPYRVKVRDSKSTISINFGENGKA